MGHQTEVRPGSVVDRAYWRAVCLTCGWRGPCRDDGDRAALDTDWHRANPSRLPLIHRRAEKVR